MMRIVSMTKKLLLFILAFLMIASCFFHGHAAESDYSGLEIKFHIELLTEEPKPAIGFSCFDVNESGYYAVVTRGIPAFVILVYSPDREFCYGISIRGGGDIAIRWEEGDIAVYFARSDTKIRIDKKGNIVAAEQHSSDTAYQELLNNTKTVNGKTYIAKHWLFSHELIHWGSYSRLVVVSNAGEEILFEGAKPAAYELGLCIMLSMLIVAVLAIMAFLLVYRKRRAKEKEGCATSLFCGNLGHRK